MIKRSSFVASLLIQLCAVPLLQAHPEESIKAAYLERFAMFIEWPNPINQYKICVHEDKNFADLLEKNYRSRLFNNRPVNIISLNAGTSEEILGTCHILYYRGSKPHQSTKTLNHLQQKHVLVISDDADDVKRGSTLSFYLQNNGYRFIINQQNLEDAKLSASYKLLNFATVVNPTGK